MAQEYAIWVQGQIDPEWFEYFSGLTVSHRPDVTTLLSSAVEAACIAWSAYAVGRSGIATDLYEKDEPEIDAI